jgi:hypothetical protein
LGGDEAVTEGECNLRFQHSDFIVGERGELGFSPPQGEFHAVLGNEHDEVAREVLRQIDVSRDGSKRAVMALQGMHFLR